MIFTFFDNKIFLILISRKEKTTRVFFLVNYLSNICIKNLTHKYKYIHSRVRVTALIDRCSMTSIERSNLGTTSLEKKKKTNGIVTICILKKMNVIRIVL